LNDSDKRAKVISLTQEGMDNVLKVKQACKIADQHFQDLYRNLNINIGQAIEMMEYSLKTSPLKP
jgi:hypothetical protein